MISRWFPALLLLWMRTQTRVYFKTLQTVNEIAQHFYYSREYVSKIFRQYYNLPLSEYLMIQKINYAKALLTEGKSVTCACSSCGFHSMSSFINAFRKRTGITPSEYKKKKKNNWSMLIGHKYTFLKIVHNYKVLDKNISTGFFWWNSFSA